MTEADSRNQLSPAETELGRCEREDAGSREHTTWRAKRTA
jgi:hypothetical protein